MSKSKNALYSLMNRIAIVGLWLCAGLALSQQARAQAENAVKEIPIKVIDGRLYVGAGYILNPEGVSTDLHLELSFEIPETMRLEREVAKWLAMAPGPKPDDFVIERLVKYSYDFVFGDVMFKVPGNELTVWEEKPRVAIHGRTTARFSKELDDHQILGSMGLGFLKKYHVEIDLAAGKMRLSAPDERKAPSGTLVRNFANYDGRLAVPFSFGNGQSGKLLLTSDRYDTLVDREFARSLQKPAGDIGSVLISSNSEPRIDLSEYMAYRPRDLKPFKDAFSTDLVLLSGVKMLECFRLEINWLTSKLALTPTGKPQYPQNDFELFKAEASGKSGEMLSFLQRYPKDKRSEEAANILMEFLLADNQASDEQYKEALGWVVNTSKPERQGQNVAAYVFKILKAQPDRLELIKFASKEALRHARNAPGNGETFMVHKVLGENYLKEGKLEDAWRHLLSASVLLSSGLTAFPIHGSLAEIYEKQERWFRAYASYMKLYRLLGGAQDPKDFPTEEELAKASEQQQFFWKYYYLTAAGLERVRKHLSSKELAMLEN